MLVQARSGLLGTQPASLEDPLVSPKHADQFNDRLQIGGALIGIVRVLLCFPGITSIGLLAAIAVVERDRIGSDRGIVGRTHRQQTARSRLIDVGPLDEGTPLQIVVEMPGLVP